MLTYEAFSVWLPPPEALFRRQPSPPVTAPVLAPGDLRWRHAPDAYFLEGRLEGFRRRDLTVEVRGNTLDIQAVRKPGFWSKEERSFRQLVELPEGADPNDVQAAFDGKELSIRIAKLPRARPRTVPIRYGGDGG